MAKGKNKLIKVTYGGKRFEPFDAKIFHIFFHGQKELHFGGHFPRCWIGMDYEANFNGEKYSIAARPKELGESDRAESEVQTWRSQNFAAEERRRTVLEKDKADRLKLPLDELTKLRELARGLKPFEIESFVRGLCRQIRGGK